MKSLLIFSALATMSSIAGAQAKTSKPDSTCTKYSDGRIECHAYRFFGPDSLMRRFSYRMDSVLANRAVLGLEVRTTGNKRDTLGVFVEAVTSKGPAEAAGIVEGDRIASINGVDLRTSSADVDDDYYSSAAGPRRLTREVQKLTPGTRVTLRVYSGGRFRDVQVTTGKASDLMRLRTANGRFPGGGFEFFGPENVIMGSEMPKLMRQDIEPMLRERLRDLPQRIQLRSLPRVRTLRILPRTYRVDRGYEELKAGNDQGFAFDQDPEEMIFDSDFTPDVEYLLPDLDYEQFDFDDDIEPLSSDAIRDLGATAVRDARAALKQLSEAGIV
jgi:PDZ domain